MSGNTPGIVFTLIKEEPLIVLMPSDHRLTARDAVAPADITAERLIGVPADKSPALRAVTDAYGAKLGIDLTPDFDVDNLSMAMSLVVSTGGIALMPLYARNLAPPTVTTRLLEGRATDHRPVAGLQRGQHFPAVKSDLGEDRRAENGQSVRVDRRPVYCGGLSLAGGSVRGGMVSCGC